MGSWSRWTSGAARTSNAGRNGCTSLPRRRRRPPGHQVESPQPDPVGSVHHSPRARVQTFPLHAVGIPELRVVEDVAASAGTSTAMRPIGSDPLCAATRHPGPSTQSVDQVLRSGQLDGAPSDDVGGQLMQRRRGQAQPQRGERIPQGVLNLRGRSSPLVAGQRAEHRRCVTAPLQRHLTGCRRSCRYPSAARPCGTGGCRARRGHVGGCAHPRPSGSHRTSVRATVDHGWCSWFATRPPPRPIHQCHGVAAQRGNAGRAASPQPARSGLWYARS